MRTKVTMGVTERALDWLLEALGQEIIEASDEEIEQAARDLRMDLRMKGSAAFVGLRYFAKPQVAEFFDLEQFEADNSRRPLGVEAMKGKPPWGK